MGRFSRLFAILLLALGAGAAVAQNVNSGTIRGVVTDSTGAVVPGVKVQVNDVDKGTTTTYTTNGSGVYDTGSIVADHYTITFIKAGFKKYVRGPITLQVETVTVNAQLEVGSTSQEVRVSADVPLLHTESGTQTTTIPAHEMEQLPNFATWETFTILMPGTSGTPTGGQSNLNPGQTASVNGNAVFYNVLGDGVTMSLPSNGNAFDYNFDTLQEVQMVTSNPTAEYENGGTIYNQISKGGTDHYHGDLFEYFQNNALDAAPYGFGQPTSVPVLRANYFGGSAGGYVPWHPFRKKVFFFLNADYQQFYGGNSFGFETVPTPAMMSGDFTGQPTIYDPTTQTITANGTLVRKSFADEYHNGNKIPIGMQSRVAQAINQYYPKINVPNPQIVDGVPTNNVFYTVPNNAPNWSYFYRVDWDITPTNRLTATEYYDWLSQPELSNDCPINCVNQHGSAITAQLSDVWTFSPTMNNEFRAGFSTQNNFFVPQSLNLGFPAKLGLTSAKANLFPEINITGACCWELIPGSNAIQHQIMMEPTDVVTLVKGKHVLHFGGEFLDEQINTTLWGNIDAGQTNYTGVYTESTQGDATTGEAYADFLLGWANGWQAINTPKFYPRNKSVQAFIQDDIKVTPNLTVNAGVRWEGWTGLSEAHGNELSWDPNVVNPAVNPFGVANTLGAMWYAKTHANGRTRVIAPIWATFLPRFGFSWMVRPSTVLRGGVGLYAYNYNEGPSAYNEIGFAEGSSGFVSDNTNGILPVLQLDQNGSVNDQGAYGSSINSLYVTAPSTPQALNGQSVNYAYYHEPLNKIWQYNLEVQQELNPNLVVNLAYVGSHGYDQLFGSDLNQPAANQLGPDDYSPTSHARPYPLFQTIGGNRLVGISNYNAMQATIEQRMNNGLMFNFNYTWSKNLNTDDPCAWNCGTAVGQSAIYPGQNYGPSDFDIRNMFKGRMIYQMPVGKGQRYLNNNSILARLVGGWQTSATFQWQGGNPFTLLTANNNSYSESGTQFVNRVPGVPIYSGFRKVGINANWFNEAAFTQPAAGTWGNTSRNSLRGPGLSNINFSFGKNFSVWRESTFQIRVDASNILNHPSFGLPNTYWGPGESAYINTVTVPGRAAEILAKLSF